MTGKTDSLRFLPVALDVREAPCLVVGGGAVGTRKVATLTRAGARVAVLAPEVSKEIAALIDDGRVRWHRATFDPKLVDGAFLVVAATDDAAVNASIVEAATQRGILVCDASDADRSQVTFGALLQRDGTMIAVFSGGRDPARARDVRNLIGQLLNGVDEEEGNT